jgi:hypothetical protein
MEKAFSARRKNQSYVESESKSARRDCKEMVSPPGRTSVSATVPANLGAITAGKAPIPREPGRAIQFR